MLHRALHKNASGSNGAPNAASRNAQPQNAARRGAQKELDAMIAVVVQDNAPMYTLKTEYAFDSAHFSSTTTASARNLHGHH